ncbi:tripartite tricarboxylate transporter TctB family protein [Catellatospora coxensis]|uniref:tripartite tricarboxylate transporter TctB family protein n=1 Tax=Catellatospora coxensis TaxID=310354 RepID=UPI0019405F6F|nr:tripartite tricarboxylate transporter TctB family protein [Catellatospora coxensis]
MQEPGAAKAAPGPIVAGGMLFAVGALLFAQALALAGERGYAPSGPGLAPVIVTGLWVLVSLGYLAESIRNRAVPTEGGGSWRTPLLLLAALIVYALVLKYTVTGYVLATAAFVLVTARTLSTRPVREVVVRDLAVAVGLSVGIYLVFTRLLGIVLPAGVLPL